MSDPNTKDRPAKPPALDPASTKVAVAAPAQPPPLTPPTPNPVRTAAQAAQGGAAAIGRPAADTTTPAVRPIVSRPPAPDLLSARDEPGPVQATHEPLQWFAADSEPGAVEVLGEEEDSGTDFVESAFKRAGPVDAKPAVPTTLVEEGTEFKGSFSSTCPIEVKGRVEGDLAAPSLRVALSGAVHGKVKVGELRSQGEIAGEFDADVANLSGVVKDKTILRARSLEMSLAPIGKRLQVVFGETGLESAAGGSKAPRAS